MKKKEIKYEVSDNGSKRTFKIPAEDIDPELIRKFVEELRTCRNVPFVSPESMHDACYEVWYPVDSKPVYNPWKNIKFRFIMWFDKILNKLKK